MKVEITINREKVTVDQTSTVLQAAEALGFKIPTLCYRDGLPHQTSCMVCMVQEMRSGQLMPACSARISEGMEIETDNDVVTASRRTALELLLSEHVGDCEGPCRRGCPAHMNIPEMLHLIVSGRFRDALIVVKRHIALPAVLGYVCAAPCENVCRRSQLDRPVSICRLKRFVAERDLGSGVPFLPDLPPETGKKVAIVGAGPAGLSAAYYLRLYGHACTLVDENDQPGGTLRTLDPAILPAEVLDAEVGLIRKAGVKIQLNQKASLASLLSDHDAILIASGSLKADHCWKNLKMSNRGIHVNRFTYQTGQPGVFACGSAVRPLKMAVIAGAQARIVAVSMHQYLNNEAVLGEKLRFQSRVGKLSESEIDAYRNRFVETNEHSIDSDALAVQAGSLCVSCECKKPNQCSLRNYAEDYRAGSDQYRSDSRHPIEFFESEDVVFEPGKCIRCGLCVRITEKQKEPLGLTFIGRGFNVRIGVPLNHSLKEGLQKTAMEVVHACPTGALTERRSE